MFYESEITRHWLAQKVVSGATLITKQHGGVYGSAAFMMIEDLQRGNADLFYLGVGRVRALWQFLSVQRNLR